MTEQATWASSASDVASVANEPGTRGLVTAGATPGTARIVAAVDGRPSAPMVVVVTAGP